MYVSRRSLLFLFLSEDEGILFLGLGYTDGMDHTMFSLMLQDLMFSALRM